MKAFLKEITEDEFEDELNEIFGEIQIGTLIFSAGRIIRELDPVAFRCGMAEKEEVWICGECDKEFATEEECCKEDIIVSQDNPFRNTQCKSVDGKVKEMRA